MKNWEKHRPETFEYVGGWIRNWFSNMAPAPIEMGFIKYASTENYYQAMKSENEEDWKRIATLAPNISKKEGRKLTLRPDWEGIKYGIMKIALKAKFRQPIWKEKLLATGDSILIEWNNWNDKVWGVSVKDNLGENLLGKALMEIREELKNE